MAGGDSGQSEGPAVGTRAGEMTLHFTVFVGVKGYICTEYSIFYCITMRVMRSERKPLKCHDSKFILLSQMTLCLLQ